MFCETCGKEIANNLKFCTGCGARIEVAAESETVGPSKIFNKLVGGLSKSVATVSANSWAIIEKTKINNVIKNQENERRRLAEILGMKVHELLMTRNEISKVDITSLVDEISKRIQIISEQNEQLKRIDAEVMMAASGNSTNLPVCGCGQVNVQGAKFCETCGNAL